jgi:hypothetical protein
LPDFVFDCGSHIVILEVDEDQHKGYQKECEIIRMKNITQGFGGLPVFWIRYNPDDFKKDNQLVQMDELTKAQHLLDWLRVSFKRQIIQTEGNTVKPEVVYLFYDGWDEKIITSDS